MLEANKTIWLEAEGYWNYGSDQVFIDYPVRFPTVTIALAPTDALLRTIDNIRMEAGYLPMIPENESNEYDMFGWYNFYISLNGFSDTMVDNSILAIVNSDIADDDGQSYDIPLTEAEQIAIYNEIDKQLKERFGTSCDELLEEARLEMIKCEEWKLKHKEVI